MFFDTYKAQKLRCDTYTANDPPLQLGCRHVRVICQKVSAVIFTFLALFLLAKRLVQLALNQSGRTYTYVGDDFPQTFSVPGLEKVHLYTEDTAHYGVNGTLADLEWSLLIPEGDQGFIRLGPQSRPFVVSMLHSLHCINRLRKAVVDRPSTYQAWQHTHHCMNYLRQIILCAADTRLNPLISHSDDGRMGIDGLNLVYTCQDWTAVYKAVEENRRQHGWV
ncbi:hypothetical protein F5I97DRAFT_1663037 [Phlebopus sp. FC_14]|nr:hypothetical protein F5I97DRAFT_1663037 [Phlebopus sp. FC_14]